MRAKSPERYAVRGGGAGFRVRSAPMGDVRYNRLGRARRRVPVAANTASATAGAIGGTPISPIPAGGSEFVTMCTSTSGISSKDSNR